MAIEFWLAISAGATFLLALAAFWAIWQNYKFRKYDIDKEAIDKSLERIRQWAEKSLEELVTPNTKFSESRDFELLTKIEIINAKCLNIFEDARRVGGETQARLHIAQSAVLQLIEDVKKGKHRKYSAKEWEEIARKLADVINATIKPHI